MIAQIQVRRGTTAEWAAASPVVLAAGEPGYDSTLKRLKIGDGSTEWAALDGVGLTSYPVGSVYTSSVSTSPATLFGGTWSAIAAGTFLTAAGTGYTAGSTGGADAHNHGLSAGYAALDAFVYEGVLYIGYTQKGSVSYTRNTLVTITGSAGSGSGSQQSGVQLYGSTDSGSSLPPYKCYYMWERTA